MERDDIIRMAREACPYTTDEMRGAFYEGFLKGAVAEREVCAKTVEKIETYEKIEKACFKFAAKKIRARGQK